MADRKARFTLLGRFINRAAAIGIDLTLNKNTEQWSADALLESYSIDRINDAMDYYFKVNPNPSWRNFANNVDGLLKSMDDLQKDLEQRILMRKKAEEWLNG